MSFLGVKENLFLVMGVANKKSVAYFVAKTLLAEGAKVILTVQSEEHQKKVQALFPEEEIVTVDVTREEDPLKLKKYLEEKEIKLQGLVHSMAFADFSKQVPFHETSWESFSQATLISSFGLVQIAGALKDSFQKNASVVTISISDTLATSYGYLGPIKAMLDVMVSYLAKSFSSFSRVRFNAVCAGPLKTSASAGIPGYIDNYLFAEALTMRKEALKTQEVADTVCFLLSERSSGINASQIRVDAGMRSNHFDEEVVKRYHSSAL